MPKSSEMPVAANAVVMLSRSASVDDGSPEQVAEVGPRRPLEQRDERDGDERDGDGGEGDDRPGSPA